MSKAKTQTNSIKKTIVSAIRPMQVNGEVKSPQRFILVFQILSLFLVLVSDKNGLNEKSFFIFIGYILLTYLSNKFVRKITTGDGYLMQIVIMLFSIGIVMIYRLSPELGLKQIIWFTAGLVVFYATYFIMKSFRGWQDLTWVYLGLCLFFFVLTLALGKRQYGAINWIKIGGFSFQLSELTKILVVFMLASYQFSSNLLKDFKYKIFFMPGVIYLFIGLFFLQKDLGTAVIIFGMYMLSLIIYKEDKRIILMNIGIAIVGGILAYFLFSHVRIRVSTWLDPWSTIDKGGYQITQSLFGIASGGFFGTGIGLGRPDLIPVAESDFIFSAICEEMGIFTGMGVIMLFLILVYRGFKISLEQNNPFYKFIALGISVIFAVQALIMFGGVLKLIPLTGVTIPFVSYGGSSIISSFISLGILQFCSSDTREKLEEA